MSTGSTVVEAVRQIEVDQAKRLKQIEAENSRLKRAIAELTLDNQILKEAAEGNF
jgi:putative transposase